MHQTVLLHCLSLPVLLPVSVFLSCSLIFAVPLLRCAHLRVCASSEIMFLLLASSLWRTMICIYVPRFSVMRLVWQMSSQEIIKKQRKRARLGVLCTQSQLSSALQQSALCIFFHHLFSFYLFSILARVLLLLTHDILFSLVSPFHLSLFVTGTFNA